MTTTTIPTSSTKEYERNLRAEIAALETKWEATLNRCHQQDDEIISAVNRGEKAQVVDSLKNKLKNFEIELEKQRLEQHKKIELQGKLYDLWEQEYKASRQKEFENALTNLTTRATDKGKLSSSSKCIVTL